MQKTLLELVQDILVAIDAENVSSVGDTEEAGMCVNIINRAYEEMMSMRRWRHLREYSQLSTSSNLNELITPSGTFAVDPNNITYDDEPVFWMDPADFLRFTQSRSVSESNIEKIGNIKVYNDRDPQYYTSVDDSILIFDTIPNNISGLDPSKSLAIIYRLPTSRLVNDGEVFDLPAIAFPALTSLCIAKALMELKGDTQSSTLERRIYNKLVGSMARNSRLIDQGPDLRDSIVPRRSDRIIPQLLL